MPELAENPIQEQMRRDIRVKANISKIKHIIGVHSGKGGVGKTTFAINLAALLARHHNVILVDADIDCPNVPKALGLKGQFQFIDKRLKPFEKYNMKIFSTGFLQEAEEQPIMFRGPLKHHALMQMLELGDLGEADYMIIDMPPGVSDIPLSVMQSLRPQGIIIVTSPQSLALLDAKRSMNMAMTMGIQVLGVVENMGGEIFGEGGGEDLAKEFNVPFLGRIALNKIFRETSESGNIAVLEDKEIARKFSDIIDKAGI